MKIVAVIVTCNRLELLPRALKSVSEQTRKPDRSCRGRHCHLWVSLSKFPSPKLGSLSVLW